MAKPSSVLPRNHYSVSEFHVDKSGSCFSCHCSADASCPPLKLCSDLESSAELVWDCHEDTFSKKRLECRYVYRERHGL